MLEHKCSDENVKKMLYDVTFVMVTRMMEMIDGYSRYSRDKHDNCDAWEELNLEVM